MPADGPAIVAPNHFSFLDHFFVAVYLRRKVQFMAKSQLFKGPLEVVYHNGGVFPGDAATATTRRSRPPTRCSRAGGIVVMYCEGGRSRSGELGEAKPGIGRLALESGAPVVPVALVGSERVRDWKRLQFPKVSVQFGDPIRFERVEDPTATRRRRRRNDLHPYQDVVERLRDNGRSATVKAARAARRGAEPAGAARLRASGGWTSRRSATRSPTAS